MSTEEQLICSCGFIGLKRNQVRDCSIDEDSEELFEININGVKEEDCDCESTVFSLDIHDHDHNDVVYVAVTVSKGGGDSISSLEALSWALNHSVTPSTTLRLIHVFPRLKLIPTPLGKIPRSHVNEEHVNIHLAQEKGKRKLLLQTFIDLCVDSKVKVEMMLIENDDVAKAIVDLVENLNIRKLVIGTTKSNLRLRQNAIADKVLKDAKGSCDIKIICEGREVIDQMIHCTSPPSIVSPEKHESRGFFVSLKRFIPFSSTFL